MRETPFLHRLAVSTPTLLPATTTNVYLVESEGHLLIVDAGYEDKESEAYILSYIEQLKIQKVAGIILTHHHRDHCPGAKSLVQAFKCPLLCHPLDQKQIKEHIAPFQIDKTIEDGDQIQVGRLSIKVLHTPGHTRGHISLWIEEENVLIAGDAIVSEGTTWIGPPDGNLQDYLKTLDRLLQLNAKQIAPGHGEMVNEPEQKIRFVIERRMLREKQILELLHVKSYSLIQLVESIYENQLHPGNQWAAERTLEGHLNKLMDEQKVILNLNGFYELHPLIRP